MSTTDAEPVQIAVTGVTGRMGQTVLETAAQREDVDVAVAVSRSPVERVAGVPVDDAEALAGVLDADPVDVLVDFTGPSSAVEYAASAAAADVGVVTGTTGFDDADRERLRETAAQTPVLWATNFSRGVAALRRAVTAAVAAVPGYDVELTETHHNGKRDAPSGTATTLLEDIESARPDLEARVHGRSGHAPREPGEIGVHARRAGNVTGEHEVLLAGNDEALTLSHSAGDRAVFAAGALDAAVWLAGRPAGWYAFDDVLDGGAP